MATLVTHTLDVYDAAGTSVAFSISSIVGDTLPHLSTIPSGDGQEFDPLTGETRAGRYTGRIADATTSGTTRVLTSRLEDASFRQQLMRRKAILKRTENGSTTVVLCPGLLTRLTLVGEAEYEYEVTDQTKIRGDVRLFTPRTATITLTADAAVSATSLTCAALSIGLPKNTVLNFGGGKVASVTANAAVSATSVSVSALVKAVISGDQANYRESVADFVVRWPRRGCAFGGPIMGGGFMDVPDYVGWLFQLGKNSVGSGLQLRFLRGSGPPSFQNSITDVNSPAIAKATNDRVGRYTPRGVSPKGIVTSGALTTFDQAERSPFAHDLIVEVLSELGGSSYGYFMPTIAAVTDNEATMQLVDVGQAKTAGTAATQPGVWLETPKTSDLPEYQTRVRARAFTASPSEISPVYVYDHPVNVVATGLTELGYSYDATSATTLVGVLGADLRYADRVTEAQGAGEYIAALQAAYGIGLRMKDNGDLEFFPTRILDNALPTVVVTAADVVTPEEGAAGPVFEITEQTAVAMVVVEFNSLTRLASGSSNPSPDGIVVQPFRIERKNGDPGVVGNRSITWRLSGMTTRVGVFKPDLDYFDVPIREVFDRFGRGVIECYLPLLSSGTAGSSNIGDEIIVTLPQLPNKNKRYGDDNSVGGRCMQIVRLTKTIWGAIAKLTDAGVNAQPYATAPTVSIAASATYPETVAELTITNAATLNAAGAGARVRIATSTGSAPASTDYADVVTFLPGQIPTAAFALPTVRAGRKVYAKARAEILTARPSSYSSTANVTLSDYTAPSGVSVTADGADGTKAGATWTVGESTLRTELFLRPTSGSTAADDELIEELQPGSSSYALRNLKPGIGYTVSVRHKDPVTSDTTAKATGTVTTASAVTTLPAPSGVRGFVGKQDGSFGIPTDTGTFGIAGRTEVTRVDVEAYQALETAVASGLYNDFILLGRAAYRQGTWTPVASRAGNDGLHRQLKMRLTPSGRHAGIASMTTGEVAALTLAEAASLDAFGLAGTFSDVVTVLPYSDTAIQKTTKTLRIHGSDFTPVTPATTDWTVNLTGAVLSTGASAEGFVTLPLPRGCTITAMRMRSRAEGANSVTVTLYEVDDASSTSLGSVTKTGASGYATTETTLTVEIDESTFVINAQLSGTTTTTLAWIEFDYTSPSLDVSL